jgi:5-(aminomethyl)-3-furanmethanol phosphate kinase
VTIGAVAPYGVSGLGRTVQTVVKLGGSLLAHTQQLDAVLQTIALVSRERGLLVVPGGGPFADAVREVDRRIGLPDTTAHWMAVLAMDQYGHVVVSRLRGSVMVSVPREVTAALENNLLPVLAPSRWLREVDPLPHSWDVTSDSISAWIAGALGAARLVLVKPNADAVHGVELVDPYFPRALPSRVTSAIVAADQIEALESALRGGT